MNLRIAAILALTLVGTTFVPVASATDQIPTLGPYVCVVGDDACRGHLACVGAVCVADPCYTTMCTASSGPDLGPLVDVCVEGRTDPTCYGFSDVCVGFSYQIPFCVDLPVRADAGTPIPPLVGVCARSDGCWGGHDACVSAFSWVPQCVDAPALASAGPEPTCMERDVEMDFGVVRDVSPDSCHASLWVAGEQVLPLA